MHSTKRVRFTLMELEAIEGLVVDAYSKADGQARKKYANILRKIEEAPKA